MNESMNYLDVYGKDFSKKSLRKYLKTTALYCIFLAVAVFSFMSTSFICSIENIHICKLTRINGDNCLVFSKEYSEYAGLFDNCGLNVTPGEEEFVTDNVFMYNNTKVHYSTYNYFGIKIIHFNDSVDLSILRCIEDNIRILLGGLNGKNVKI